MHGTRIGDANICGLHAMARRAAASSHAAAVASALLVSLAAACLVHGSRAVPRLEAKRTARAVWPSEAARNARISGAEVTKTAYTGATANREALPGSRFAVAPVYVLECKGSAWLVGLPKQRGCRPRQPGALFHLVGKACSLVLWRGRNSSKIIDSLHAQHGCNCKTDDADKSPARDV
jgi:hypothetical protein